jgi:hypothetical protein
MVELAWWAADPAVSEPTHDSAFGERVLIFGAYRP